MEESKHLEIPMIRYSGLHSSVDLSPTDQIQSEMDYVNRKLEKAKQSIS